MDVLFKWIRFRDSMKKWISLSSSRHTIQDWIKFRIIFRHIIWFRHLSTFLNGHMMKILLGDLNILQNLCFNFLKNCFCHVEAFFALNLTSLPIIRIETLQLDYTFHYLTSTENSSFWCTPHWRRHYLRKYLNYVHSHVTCKTSKYISTN
jgi:hypothetical protein